MIAKYSNPTLKCCSKDRKTCYKLFHPHVHVQNIYLKRCAKFYNLICPNNRARPLQTQNLSSKPHVHPAAAAALIRAAPLDHCSSLGGRAPAAALWRSQGALKGGHIDGKKYATFDASGIPSSHLEVDYWKHELVGTLTD